MTPAAACPHASANASVTKSFVSSLRPIFRTCFNFKVKILNIYHSRSLFLKLKNIEILNQDCPGKKCKADQWSEWSDCSATCGPRAMMTKTRNCVCPPGQCYDLSDHYFRHFI